MSSVAILGSNRLAEDWHRLARDNGLSADRYTRAAEVDPATEVIVETLAHGAKTSGNCWKSSTPRCPGPVWC